MNVLVKKNEFRALFSTIALINFVFTCHAQVSKGNDYVLAKDILYSTGDTLKADFYLPVNYEMKISPALIFINGFGGDVRNWDHYTDWAGFAASNGFVGVVYAAREGEVKRNFTHLLNFVHSGTNPSFIDTNRISIYAASGNVNAGLPIANGDARVKAALIYYGTAKMESFRLNLPVLLVRAGLDNVQLNKQMDSLAFNAMVNNAPYTVSNFNTALHAFEESPDKKISIQFQKFSMDFLTYSMRDDIQRDFSANAMKIQAMRELYASNWKSAYEAYLLVIQNDPVDNEAERQLGNICIELKEYKRALNYYKSALDHGNWRKGEIALKKIYAYAKLDSADAAVNEMRLLKKIGWFKEKDYAGKEEYASVMRSASYIKFSHEK